MENELVYNLKGYIVIISECGCGTSNRDSELIEEFIQVFFCACVRFAKCQEQNEAAIAVPCKIELIDLLGNQLVNLTTILNDSTRRIKGKFFLEKPAHEFDV